MEDNKTNLTLTKDLESWNCTKHIDVMYYHIQGLVEDGELGIEWISNLSMLANGLTKSLSATTFKKYQEKWGLEA